ncbi:MAG: hypothetical protein LBD38_00240 [Streptococcaceae bacterium]|nr:hypothetical protein [Streptococcaceae bacterium]
MLKIVSTTFRDAHQSLAATRMTTEQMKQVAKEEFSAGFFASEMWGGATFDVMMRFLNENPWTRIDELKAIRDEVFEETGHYTNLQMLLRASNLLGYKAYPDDVMNLFIKRMADHGMDIVRIFDAMNNPTTLEVPIKLTKKYGMHAQGCIVYAESPLHNEQYFLDLAENLIEYGVDSLCIKDMAGIGKAEDIKNLILALKSKFTVPIDLHMHDGCGTADDAYFKAVTEAGVDIIDLAISPLSGGSSQPAVESTMATLKTSGIDLGLDKQRINVVADWARRLREEWIADFYESIYETGKYAPSGANASNEGVLDEDGKAAAGLIDPSVLTPDPRTLDSAIPGGMLSNYKAQLRIQGKEELFDLLLPEIQQVRKDFSYVAAVTPTSQYLGSTAFMNVLSAGYRDAEGNFKVDDKKRYHMLSSEVKDFLKGYIGEHLEPIPDDVLERAGIDKSECIHVRPGEILPDELPKLMRELNENKVMWGVDELLMYAMFPPVAMSYFKRHNLMPVEDELKNKGIHAAVTTAPSSVGAAEGFDQFEIEEDIFELDFV